MPITNGNYTAPDWVNNQAPAINDTELTAMSTTLQGAQILAGSGAPTQYTSGEVGQLYVDTSTTPNTIYQCKVKATDANLWEMASDPNTNLALQYSASATYAAGAYRIYGGLLYRSTQAITTPEAWNAAHWARAWAAIDLAAHKADTNNPHQVTKAQAGLGNVANVLQYSAANPPKVLGSISLAAAWSGSGPYYQTVTVSGATVTANSKIDLQLTAAQISALITNETTSLLIENNNGTLTAWATGAAPSAAMTVQCTVEETGT